MILDGDSVSAIAAINDRGAYVAVIPPTAETTISADEQQDTKDDESGITIYQSLYETAIKNDIPRSIIEQLVRIFFYDIDLQRKVVGGDGLELFYAEDEENPEKYDLLYASLSIAGVTKRYFPFKADDGTVDFFDEQGKSNRKFLVRKPISEGILRSGFGMRYHPILHYSRLHSGVDWANKIGTPILAAGDGVITKAEWTNGYGRHIEIQHAYDFETTYSHLSAYAKGVVEGARVRQGQVIGYLGSSGLSTGPHLHYEVKVKGEFKDPLAIKLPKNRELNPKELVLYKTEKTEIESIMAKAPNPSRVASSQP
jgi:murein DD-endopeptidase MepM/ murein hydrolase activator NlpD